MPGTDLRPSPSLDASTNWAPLLSGCDAVVHAAARVHVMRETSSNPLAEFRKANVLGTLTLARQAAEAGVRRFIFLSSIKVNGEETMPGRAFTAYDDPAPADSYAISKLEAERGLRELSAETGMEVAIIRPPLVYGPGVKANFRSMLRWVNRGIPLPLGAIHNKRSLVALENLIDLIGLCLEHPAASGRVVLAADGEDLSTTELLQRIGRALDKPARLIRVPCVALRVGAAVLGRGEIAQRLCGSLQVDTTGARALLGWTAPVSVDDAMSRTARYFLEHDTA